MEDRCGAENIQSVDETIIWKRYVRITVVIKALNFYVVSVPLISISLLALMLELHVTGKDPRWK